MTTPKNTTTDQDFKRAGEGFSFTGKLAELARNREWVDGYNALVDGVTERNGFTNLWAALSAGTETVGNELYTSIRNYVDNIGNVDTCGIAALRNYADMLCVRDDSVDIRFEFPKEIRELVEIFSVDRAYLFNKAASLTRSTCRGVFGSWDAVPSRSEAYEADGSGSRTPVDGDYIYVQNCNGSGFDYEVPVSSDCVGLVLAEDVYIVGVTDDDGNQVVLLPAGQVMTFQDVKRLQANGTDKVSVRRTGTWMFRFRGTWSDFNGTRSKNLWGVVRRIGSSVMTRGEIDEADAADAKTERMVSLENTILGDATIERVIDSLKDDTKYRDLVRETFYNTLSRFLNMKVGEHSEQYAEIDPSTEIWRLNVSRLTDGLWDDDVESDTDVYALKRRLGVGKSFTEKVYVDDIIASRRKITDFTENEQTVLKAEMESRQTRYGRDTSMKYYFMRLYKVIEYFRFTTVAYRNSYTLDEYALTPDKYVVSDGTSDKDTVLKFSSDGYAIDRDIVMRVAEWLSDHSFNLRAVRARIKAQCQKNMMCGTKRLLVDSIREYLLERIDSDTWENFRSTALFNADLNTNFDVSLVEYSDPTEYFNVINPLDTADANENHLNVRYWERGYDDNCALGNSELLDFYNRLTDSRTTFTANSQAASGSDEPNLYDFLASLFSMGATENGVADIGASTTSYASVGGSEVEETGVDAFGETEEAALRKYSGDPDHGDVPYANEKNRFHSSYQIHPYLNAFEEYSTAYTGIMNLVNSFSVDIEESRSKLSKRIDELGNTINFWLNWNEDFTGYSTNYEKGGDDNDPKFNQDSPFNFDALEELLSGQTYVDTLIAGTNRFYVNESTGKFILDADGVDFEVRRIRRCRSKIAGLSGKAIARYGKDCHGNIYMLYKDADGRGNPNALGEMWVRMKDHPLAFPMFDASQDGTGIGGVGCVYSTENGTLNALVSNGDVRFEKSYGSSDTGRVDCDGLSLSTFTASGSAIVTVGSDGTFVGATPPSSLAGYRMSSSGMTLVTINDQVLDPNGTFYYYVDTVTNEVIPSGMKIDIGAGVEVDTDDRKFVPVSDQSAFTASFNGDGTCSFGYIGGRMSFVSYTDTPVSGTFLYHPSGNMDITRACSKRRVSWSGDVQTVDGPLEGTYSPDGTVVLSEAGLVSNNHTPDKNKLSDLGIVQTVDGGLIRIDPYGSGNVPTFAFTKDVPVEIRTKYGSILNDSTAESDSYVVEVCGCYFYAVPVYDMEDDNVVDTTNRRTVSLGVYPLGVVVSGNKVVSDPTKPDFIGCVKNSVVFGSDDYARTDTPPELTLSSSKGYGLSEIVFEEGGGNDSIRRFHPAGSPEKVYSPVASITTPVTSMSELPTGGNYKDRAVHTVEICGLTCYYYLKDETVNGYDVNSEVRVDTVTSTVLKFSGGFTLHSTAYDDTPVSLSFGGLDEPGNVMTYSSDYVASDQTKFHDFTMSYDQRKMFLCHAPSESANGYPGSGVIVGRIEMTDGRADGVKFMKGGLRNLEFVDPRSCGMDFHIGEATNRFATFSAFGRYSGDDENGGTMDVALFVFSRSDMESYNFRFPFRYALHKFKEADGMPMYSAKAVATDTRLYLAFTCDTPVDSEVLGNTLNGVSGGTVGSSTFGQIKDYCGDSVIAIHSFDVEKLSNIDRVDSETRFIMENGALGYFPQYPGIRGKNLVFSNSQLSGDDRFPFYAQFTALDTDNGPLELVEECKCNPPKGKKFGRFAVSRFVDTYDGKDAVRGFAFSDDTPNFAYHVKLSSAATTGEVSKIPFPNPVYDISRFTADGTGNVHVFAQGIDYASYVDALSCNGDCTSVTPVRVPVWSSRDGHTRTDFVELFDTDTKEAFAFHSDGYTVSRIVLRKRTGPYFLSGVANLTDASSVDSSDTVPYRGITTYSGDGFCSWTTVVDKPVATWLLGGVSRTETLQKGVGSVQTTVVSSGGLAYPCAMYTSGESIVFARFDPFAADDIEEVSEDAMDAEKIIVSGDTGLFACATTMCAPHYVDGHAYCVFGLKHKASDGIPAKTGLLVVDVNMTGSDGKWKVGLSLKDTSVPDVAFGGGTNPETLVCRTGAYVVVSASSGSSGWLGYIDANLAYSGSTAEACKVYDYDGETEISLEDAGQPVSVGNRVVVSADGGRRILVSDDRGLTFKSSSEAVGSLKSVVGCTRGAVYAVSPDNRYALSSTDGEQWNRVLDLGDAKWSVLTDGLSDIAVCTSTDEATGNPNPIDEDDYVEVVEQTSVYGDHPYDKMFASRDGSGIVLVGGISGDRPLEISVTGDLANFRHKTFSHTKGIEYTSAYLFGGDLYLSPRYSNNVLKVSGVLDGTKEMKATTIDISSAVNNEAVEFGGFEEVNGVLILYPLNGKRMLALNPASGSFVNYYTMRRAISVADSDELGEKPGNELLFTMSESGDDGSIRFMRTKFTGRNDYGIVEIDNGFPILVTYEKVETDLDVGGGKTSTVSVYEFTFTMMNADRKTTAKVITVPKGNDAGKFKEKFESRVRATAVYTVGNESVTYTFATVDDTTKYCIYRNVFAEPVEDDEAYFTLTYDLNTSRRKTKNLVTYSSTASGKYSVLDGFEPGSEYVGVLEANGTSENVKLDKFAKYGFTSTAAFSGEYEVLKPCDEVDAHLADSNLQFMSPNTTFHTLVNMFADCGKAKFSRRLTIGTRKNEEQDSENPDKRPTWPSDSEGNVINPTNASCMFKGCTDAVLPEVDIGGSALEDVREMFSGCRNAVLGGVSVPSGATDVKEMFRDCSACKFDSISSVPKIVNDLTGVFRGCENGTFGNFSFFNFNGNTAGGRGLGEEEEAPSEGGGGTPPGGDGSAPESSDTTPLSAPSRARRSRRRKTSSKVTDDETGKISTGDNLNG